MGLLNGLFWRNMYENYIKTPKMYILIGPPGSGKSTFAQKLQNVHGIIRISQDDRGRDEHKELLKTAMDNGGDVCIDRMNFNTKQREYYFKLAAEYTYLVEVHYFFVNKETCLQRMSERKDHPTIRDEQSMHRALNMFYKNFEYLTPAELEQCSVPQAHYQEAPADSRCIIVDIDGTIADLSHRNHFVTGEGKKDWKSFFANVDKDTPIDVVYDIAKSYAIDADADLIFCSGRPDDIRKPTEEWLKRHEMFGNRLLMRARGDFRRDDIIKEQILDFEILTRYKKVLASFDDRSQVVSMWRRRGIKCLQVEPGEF